MALSAPFGSNQSVINLDFAEKGFHGKKKINYYYFHSKLK
jgi:hypothetical protein